MHKERRGAISDCSPPLIDQLKNAILDVLHPGDGFKNQTGRGSSWQVFADLPGRKGSTKTVYWHIGSVHILKRNAAGPKLEITYAENLPK